MSLIIETSPKHCANKGFHPKRLFKRKFIYGFSTFLSTILFTILLVYLILHPSKPQFSLKETAISGLNSTTQVTLTLLSKNPNTKVGIYYENVQAYAVYKGQKITEDSQLPSFYQGCEESSILSTTLSGTNMPVSASIGYGVGRDQMVGKFVMSVQIDGQLRWKIGFWTSGKNRLNVDCVAIIGPAMSTAQRSTQCSTSV